MNSDYNNNPYTTTINNEPTNIESNIEITAINMLYNENEKEIVATGLEKDFIVLDNPNFNQEIELQAFDSKENEVILPTSLSNQIKANRNRRLTKTAIAAKKNEAKNQDTMQK